MSSSLHNRLGTIVGIHKFVRSDLPPAMPCGMEFQGSFIVQKSKLKHFFSSLHIVHVQKERGVFIVLLPERVN